VITRHRNMLEQDRRKELAEKELRYRTLVEQIPGITYMISISANNPRDFKIIYLSPRFENWLGYPIADFYQDPSLWMKIIVPEDRERLLTSPGRNSLTDKLSMDEYRIISRDNQTLWVRDMFRSRHGETPAENIIQGLLLNITEQKYSFEKSRRESERTAALLRVAGRLNTQLDLDTLLSAISEEVCKALNTPVSIVGIYDQKQGFIQPTGGMGLGGNTIKNLPPVEKPALDELFARRGHIFAMRDVQELTFLPNTEQYAKLNFKSIAFAVMEFEQKMIGSLTALTVGEPRDFTEDELLLLHGIADQAALAIVNTSLYKYANHRLEKLQALRAIDIAISSNRNLQETLDVVLAQITKQLQVDAAVILLLNEAGERLEFGASRGFQSLKSTFKNLRVGEGMAGRAVQQRQIVHVHDLRVDSQALINAPSLAREGFVSYYAAPLISQGQVKGVLEVFHRSLLDPDNEWLDFLEILAGQAAIAIENAALFENLQLSNDELSRAYDSTIEGWSHALDLRDKETEGHTRRVTEMTLELARRFGFSEADLVHVKRGALLHDIGKMGIPDRILLKEGPLTDEEWVIMRQHPEFARDMLLPIDYLRQAIDIPYYHHEKWDGTGYPRGLKGEEIPLVARIFAVVDVWDAVTSDRPYRAGWSREKALAHILEGAGHHFDARVVEVFVNLIKEKSMDK
jgi:putative nucleotidyltransferase with HDIG domain